MTDFALKNMDANTLVTEIWNGSKSWHTFVVDSPLKNGIWTNLLFIWDKSALKISKNGIEIGRVNFTETTDSRFGLLFPIAPLLPTQLIFGGETKMYLDDIKIWNRPLSDEEANQVYEEGKIEFPSFTKLVFFQQCRINVFVAIDWYEEVRWRKISLKL